MTWVPYLALQYFWASERAYTNYAFVLYAGTAVTLQGVWNCFNYTRTRHLKHARELFSSIISSLGSVMRQSSAGGFTEHETRYTTLGAATAAVSETNRSLLDDNDDDLLTYFTSSWPPNEDDYDDNFWIANNDLVPILPSFYPLLRSSISIPNGSAFSIAERIKQTLRDRSIVAVYDSRGAKADCTTRNNIDFRLRFYRSGVDLSTIIVEIQRRQGFNVMYHQDVNAIFDAAEGKAPEPDEVYVTCHDLPDDHDNYTQSSLDRLSAILCPDNSELKFKDIELALPVLVSLTNVRELGQTAVLTSKDLLCSERFVRLRDAIVSHACLHDNESYTSFQYKCIKHQSLEILANATFCLKDDQDTLQRFLNESLLTNLVLLVENAAADPRAADLACLVLHNTGGSQKLDVEQNERLQNALVAANEYGIESHADLQDHSQECLSLLYSVPV